jgi:hypothetical protein
MFDDDTIVNCLDEQWRAVPEIRSRLRTRDGVRLVSILRRLAKSGMIERQTAPTTAPKRIGATRVSKYGIEYFRSVQARERNYGRES